MIVNRCDKRETRKWMQNHDNGETSLSTRIVKKEQKELHLDMLSNLTSLIGIWVIAIQ